MYKTVLLTENEISLVRKVISEYLHKNLSNMRYEEVNNLHIIDRTLIGKQPTEKAYN